MPPSGHISANHKNPPLPGSEYELSKNRIALTEERVDLAYRGLVASLSKAEIKRCLKAKFGLGFRACEDIITAAIRRRALDANQGGDPEVSRGEALAFYQHVRDSGKSAIRYKLRAQERIDKILGHEAAQQHEVKSVQFSLADALVAIEQAKNGSPITHQPAPPRLPDDRLVLDADVVDPE